MTMMMLMMIMMMIIIISYYTKTRDPSAKVGTI